MHDELSPGFEVLPIPDDDVTHHPEDKAPAIAGAPPESQAPSKAGRFTAEITIPDDMTARQVYSLVRHKIRAVECHNDGFSAQCGIAFDFRLVDGERLVATVEGDTACISENAGNLYVADLQVASVNLQQD